MPSLASYGSAYDALTEMLRAYGLESLSTAVLTFLQDGYTQDQVGTMLQDTPEYKTRFAGNERRKAAGLPVLSARDYLSTESAYHQILSSSGMPVGFYDQHSDFVDWIGKDVSPQEVSSRVGLAVDAANKLDPQTKDAFQQWYGVGPNDLAAFFLDQDRALPHIQKIAKAVNIGGDARRDNLTMDKARAETLAGFAGDRNVDQLMGQVAQLAQRGEALSNIHGGDDYRQGEAESEIFQSSETARRKRAGLVQMEEAAFSGSSGVGKSTLAKTKSY